MYFWRIEKLKSAIIAKPLSDREVLPYLICIAMLPATACGLPSDDYLAWDLLVVVYSTVLALVGTIYIYRQNGGSNGRYLLQRYLATGWVVSIRCGTIAAVVYAGILIFEVPEANVYGNFLIAPIVEAITYWRTGHHIREIAYQAQYT